MKEDIFQLICWGIIFIVLTVNLRGCYRDDKNWQLEKLRIERECPKGEGKP